MWVNIIHQHVITWTTGLETVKWQTRGAYDYAAGAFSPLQPYCAESAINSQTVNEPN